MIDSNVLVAALVEAHQHHAPSHRLLGSNTDLAVAAHSLAEAFATLTAPAGPFRWRPEEAVAALDAVRARARLLGLTPEQTFAAIRSFAAQAGVGARLHDRLLGEVAVVHRLGAIVTWNVRHMAGLFPNLMVVSPPDMPV